MTRNDKPFICVQSRWGISIKPRNRAGWIALGLWLLAATPIAAGFELLMSRNPSQAQTVAYVAVFVLAMTVWAVAMTLWMKARSEIVDLRK